jgi:RNA-directed DNA polymerase
VQLLAQTYRPVAVRRVSIPKPGKHQEKRPLGIPVVRDRVVQASAKLVLEPIFEAGFRKSSYGFRPRRNAQQAVERIRWDVNFGRYFVVDVDIADFFGSLQRAPSSIRLGRCYDAGAVECPCCITHKGEATRSKVHMLPTQPSNSPSRMPSVTAST